MDRQLFVDRLLESENLTGNLEDDDANLLLDWGIAQIDGLIAGLEDDELAGTRINHLMRFMRSINELAGNLQATTSQALSDLLERYVTTFGQGHQASDSERSKAAATLSSMEPGAAIRYLLDWCRPR